MFEQAGVATWSIDPATGDLRMNRAARAVLGWAEDGPPPTAAALMEAVHPEDRQMVQDHVAALRKTGQPYVILHRLLLGDGGERHMKSVAGADLDDSGRVRALHGVTLDVTDLRRAQQQEHEQRELGRWILDSLTEGYVLIRHGIIVEVNDAMCRMTGFGAAELIGSTTPHPYWPRNDPEQLHELTRRMMRPGSGATEFDAVHRNGRSLRLSMTGRSLQRQGEPAVWLVLFRDVTDERELERSLRSTAATDPLTGVPNSRAFRPQLRAAVDEHIQTGSPLSLALIDIDHFKRVNDRFGHAVGDEVLVAVAERLVGATKQLGSLARVGGEEFALLMSDVDAAAAHQGLTAALATLAVDPIGVAGTITASAGVAELHDHMTDDMLYRFADELLYEAKARGRNQVR